jgi:hypothetical protein
MYENKIESIIVKSGSNEYYHLTSWLNKDEILNVANIGDDLIMISYPYSWMMNKLIKSRLKNVMIVSGAEAK